MENKYGLKDWLSDIKKNKKQKVKQEPPVEYQSHRVVYSDNDGGAGAKRKIRSSWISIGIAIGCALFMIILLLIPHKSQQTEAVQSETQTVQATPVPSKQTSSVLATETPEYDQVNIQVNIKEIQSSFTAPTQVSIGVQQTVDLSDIGSTIATNVYNAGWGAVNCSLTEDGALLIAAANPAVLTGSDFDAQKEFLASGQPENYARTFLQDSNISALLERYGFGLSTNAINNNGEITFEGHGQNEQSTCSITFSFLYTGAFNQAVLKAERVDGNYTTTDVLSVKKAAANAVSWSSVGSEDHIATEVTLEYIQGLPFYVFTLENGEKAYALAVKESELSQIPETIEIYEEIMTNGLQDTLILPGAE